MTKKLILKDSKIIFGAYVFDTDNIFGINLVKRGSVV